MATPCDPALGIEIFKITDQQHPKVDAWRNARTAFLRIKLAALVFDPCIKLLLGQQSVQPAVKRMTWSLRQRLRGDPEFRLRCLLLAERHSYPSKNALTDDTLLSSQ